MNNVQKHAFKSESKELLKLMIHSLYSNKEIFIRELISNASDAIDKLRFLSISQPDTYPTNTKYCINIDIDTNLKKITISDNGIGMSKEEVITNLGTIAKSGTKKFIQSLQEQNVKNHELIGQFGVGFYSSFIVSDKVSVHTRSAKNIHTDTGCLWESDGKGQFTVQIFNKPSFGTDVTLFLKGSEEEFLQHSNIENIINKYSDHISVPINIKKHNKLENKYTWQQTNKAQSLWTLRKSQISEQEYINFYKYITKDTQNPLIWSHNKVEGNQEYTMLLYIPSKKPLNIWDREQKHGLKLYVKKIFIMDDTKQFLPNYLRFVKGLIDSNDLPLNVSREILQKNILVKKIRQTITKKILNTLQTLLNTNIEKYNCFWKEFSTIFKEGPAEDFHNKELITKLLLFASLNNKHSKQTLSLKKYIENMPKDQEKIYFLTSDNYESARNSPHLEIFKKNNIDVLLLFERVDEWMMNYLTEYQDKKFQSASIHDEFINSLAQATIEKNNLQENLQPLLDKIKKVLGDKIKEVRLTYRLINTPSILLSDTNGMSTQMAKLFSAAGQPVPPIKYIFEINPNHFLIKKISKLSTDKDITNWILLLFEQSLLIEKGTLNDPNTFVTRINELLCTLTT